MLRTITKNMISNKPSYFIYSVCSHCESPINCIINNRCKLWEELIDIPDSKKKKQSTTHSLTSETKAPLPEVKEHTNQP
jgi:hypothetical protein